jgi:hypothetical protein
MPFFICSAVIARETRCDTDRASATAGTRGFLREFPHKCFQPAVMDAETVSGAVAASESVFPVCQ